MVVMVGDKSKDNQVNRSAAKEKSTDSKKNRQKVRKAESDSTT
jgi:hypothetical protein